MHLWLREALDAAASARESPKRLFLPRTASDRFARVADRAAELSHNRPALRPCYSVKTNPRRELLDIARAAGFLAETISPEEVEAAASAGFRREDIVRNGPRPHVYDERGPLHAHFADSLEALAESVARPAARVAGARIRPAGTVSRFGLRSDELPAAAALLSTLSADSELGLSLHVRPEDYAGRSWFDLFDALGDAAAVVGGAARRPVTVLDAGGGWTPDALERALAFHFPRVLDQLRGTGVREVLMEPGQSLATVCEALLVTVLETRPSRGEIVIDAGVNALPQRGSFAHRAYWVRDGEARRVEPGTGRALGPLCLEYDVPVDSITIPPEVRAGDLMLIADCGAYDASMAFRFGAG